MPPHLPICYTQMRPDVSSEVDCSWGSFSGNIYPSVIVCIRVAGDVQSGGMEAHFCCRCSLFCLYVAADRQKQLCFTHMISLTFTNCSMCAEKCIHIQQKVTAQAEQQFFCLNVRVLKWILLLQLNWRRCRNAYSRAVGVVCLSGFMCFLAINACESVWKVLED